MDLREFRLRQMELVLAQNGRRFALRHAYLQQRFLLALTLAGGVFLSTLRAEVPLWGGLAAIPALAWAAWENRRIDRLSSEEQSQGLRALKELDHLAPQPEGLTPQEENRP